MFTPHIGDKAIVEVLPSSEIAEVKVLSPNKVQLYMFDPHTNRLVKRDITSINEVWEYVPNLPILFGKDRTALETNLISTIPIDNGVAIVPISKHEIYSIGRVTEEDPIMVGDIILENNGYNWKDLDLEIPHIIHFVMDSTPYIPYLRHPSGYLKSPNNRFTITSILTTGVVGLVHQTNLEHVISMIHSRWISSPITTVSDLQDLNYYPGIYTRLLTQYDVMRYLLQTNRDYGDIQLLISPAIMKQRNWHLKVIDSDGIYGYGTITNLTFGPESLTSYIDQLPSLWGETIIGGYANELIVHDPIPIEFVNIILVRTEVQQRTIEAALILSNLQGRVSVRIINRELNDELIRLPPNMKEIVPLSTLPPQYCYTGRGGINIDNFENFNPYNYQQFQSTTDESEYLWKIRMDNCGLPYNEKQSIAERIRMIEDRMKVLYFDGAERTVVSSDHYPPFKYIPGWYQ